jgi:hypothetical protein
MILPFRPGKIGEPFGKIDIKPLSGVNSLHKRACSPCFIIVTEHEVHCRYMDCWIVGLLQIKELCKN